MTSGSVSTVEGKKEYINISSNNVQIVQFNTERFITVFRRSSGSDFISSRAAKLVPSYVGVPVPWRPLQFRIQFSCVMCVSSVSIFN
jgi:hypothetical protein